MFYNYIKIAFRNLWRNKAFSAINILGFAIGLATCLLITLFVTDELSYDKFHEKANRIYRINADFLVNGSSFNERTVPAKFGPALVKDYPQIETMARTRTFGNGDISVKKGNETIIEHNCVFADSTLPDVFTLQFIGGNPKTALTQPKTMVVSETIAKKYFNSTDVIGKSLVIEGNHEYFITGVIKDMPAQSHVHFNFIMAMSELDDSRNANWMTDNFVTYLLVKPGVNKSTIDGYLNEATRKYMQSELVKLVGSDIDMLEKKGGHFRYSVIPITDIHLRSTLTSEAEASGNIQYVYIFIVVAVFILLIACVNFMNLSTARSAGRSKEVGMRKVMGSMRRSLVWQFLIESILTSFVALIIAIIITMILLPFVNQLSGKNIQPGWISNQFLLPSLILASVLVGILAGSYPAFFLSAFEPVKVLKGKLANGFKSSWLRNSLVVFQFIIAIVLIVGTFVIYSQLNYIRNKELGYNREQILQVKNAGALGEHAVAFKNDVLRLPGVQSGTMNNAMPVIVNGSTNVYSKTPGREEGQVLGLGEWFVDADYIPTLGMKMISGRNFSPQMPTDTMAILLNETAANLLGYNDLKDRYLYLGSGNYSSYHVIGIIKDFNTGSLRNKIPPLVLRLGREHDNIAFRIRSSDIPSLIAKIEDRFHATPGLSGQAFTYTFLDDDFNKLYASEQRTGKIFISFAFFAILIACLGLFGLVTYAAEQRTKEIGIRKVLGASVGGIVSLLSKDFIKLVLIAFIIASPIAWVMMNKWLQDFTYRIKISWWVFAATALLAMLITLGTVCFRAIRAALSNPVKNLRSE